MLTLNQHIKLFSDFASSHLVIKSFDFGDPWEWFNSLKGEGESLTYPAMFVAPKESAISEGLLTRRYTIFFCERERHAEENDNDALSDCERLWFDFIAYMYKSLNNSPVSIQKSLSATPVTESGVDYVVAYTGDFSLVEDFDYNVCVVPIAAAGDNSDTLIWYNTDNITVSNNGYTLAPSGAGGSSWTNKNPWSEDISLTNVFTTEFTMANQTSMFGVAKTTKTSNNYTDIDYAFSRQGTTDLYIYELGANVSTIAGTSESDTLKIVANGTNVKYYVNDVLKYTSATAPTANAYKLKMSSYQSIDVLINIL